MGLLIHSEQFKPRVQLITAASTEQASIHLSHAHERSLSGQILQNSPSNNCLNQWLPLVTSSLPTYHDIARQVK